ncbi:MAG: beta-lactamase family protein [Alphaproteobacteria bacterium]|nr:beta-lactamase family protein [Alphaproteobacteria bacterium]
MRLRDLFIALVMAAFVLAAFDAAPKAPIVTTEVSDGILAENVNRAVLATASQQFGGAVIIEQDGKVVLKAGYGYADRERQIPFRTDTIAQIGSISKSFTAAAVANLESDGKIDPHAKVSLYLKELVGRPAGAATIQQLLTHTGGYPEYCGDDFKPSSSKKMLHDCLAPLQAKPGHYAYSNAGYSALALIVERTSDMSLEAYVKSRITEPLGMRSTGYLFADSPPERFASGYLNGVNQGVISNRIARLNGDYWNLKGNGGIQSTPVDMMAWGHALFGAHPTLPVLANKLSDRGTWVPTDDANIFYSYGLNIVLRADGSVQRISHSGSDGVFLSLIRWYPVEKVLIYFVGNSGEDDVKKTMQAAIAAVKAAAPLRD